MPARPDGERLPMAFLDVWRGPRSDHRSQPSSRRCHSAPVSALPCPADQSLGAEDRSAAGVRDRTEPEPDAHAVAKSTTDSPRSSSARGVCDPIEPRPPASLIHLACMRGDVGRNLLLEGDGKHPPGTLTDQLVEVDDELGAALLPHYTQHRGVPSSSAVARRRPPACWSSRKVRRTLIQEADPQLQVIPPREPRTSSTARTRPMWGLTKASAKCGLVSLVMVG
jgi:hypothetical protein